jgi:MinD superfamily P-loop ATPase
MIIAVASGKGGTGKTTIAVNLALSLENVQYLDCDVEEPNGAIFLKPSIKKRISVALPVPEFDETKCTHCKKCVEACAYNAIVFLGQKILFFPQLCHGCGGCRLICPENAITEHPRQIGLIEQGPSGAIDFIQGLLNVGEPMATPIIKQERKLIDKEKIVILDAPPGTSCPVIETVRHCDYCILVTEPTPFGLNDLKLAVDTMRALNISFGVVINCSDIGDDEVNNYCTSENIPVLLELPWDRRIAEAYSRGESAVAIIPEMKKDFHGMYNTILTKLCI